MGIWSKLTVLMRPTIDCFANFGLARGASLGIGKLRVGCRITAEQVFIFPTALPKLNCYIHTAPS